MKTSEKERQEILDEASNIRWEIGENFHDSLMESIYAHASTIAGKAVSYEGKQPKYDFDRTIDKIVTSKWLGFPIMFMLLALVFWLTVQGANYPSSLLSTLLLDHLHPILKDFGFTIGLPGWLNGLLIDGGYLAAAWVVAVMLPPMAIFFPLFTLLEDFGYLPRVAFNMDNLFRRAGAHGKQALTMSMGFGCNAAGVVATRIIDSPRERLIAIITNFNSYNFYWRSCSGISSRNSICSGCHCNCAVRYLFQFGCVLGIIQNNFKGRSFGI